MSELFGTSRHAMKRDPMLDQLPAVRELTAAEIKQAQRLAAAGDYEVGHLLSAYLHGGLDEDGIRHLLEEVTA